MQLVVHNPQELIPADSGINIGELTNGDIP